MAWHMGTSPKAMARGPPNKKTCPSRHSQLPKFFYLGLLILRLGYIPRRIEMSLPVVLCIHIPTLLVLSICFRLSPEYFVIGDILQLLLVEMLLQGKMFQFLNPDPERGHMPEGESYYITSYKPYSTKPE